MEGKTMDDLKMPSYCDEFIESYTNCMLQASLSVLILNTYRNQPLIRLNRLVCLLASVWLCGL